MAGDEPADSEEEERDEHWLENANAHRVRGDEVVVVQRRLLVNLIDERQTDDDQSDAEDAAEDHVDRNELTDGALADVDRADHELGDGHGKVENEQREQIERAEERACDERLFRSSRAKIVLQRDEIIHGVVGRIPVGHLFARRRHVNCGYLEDQHWTLRPNTEPFIR